MKQLLKAEKLTQEKVKRLFEYKDGRLCRKIRVGGSRIKIGEPLSESNTSHGYLRVSINGKRYTQHLIVWIYHFGRYPIVEIDHINRNRSDNRIENLREVSRLLNLRNSSRRSDSFNEVKGVSWCSERNKWVAYINNNKKRISIGRFSDFFEAVCYRLAYEQCLNWDAMDSNTPAYLYVKRNLSL